MGAEWLDIQISPEPLAPRRSGKRDNVSWVCPEGITKAVFGTGQYACQLTCAVAAPVAQRTRVLRTLVSVLGLGDAGLLLYTETPQMPSSLLDTKAPSSS
jgi:hypothetical protein